MRRLGKNMEIILIFSMSRRPIRRSDKGLNKRRGILSQRGK
jgi:hypothetical protein